MFTQNLTQAVEGSWERITARTIDEIRRDQRLPHMRELPEAELREWGRGILTSLPVWPLTLDEEELAARYQRLGRERFRESVPLHETIRSLHHLRCKLIACARDECFPQNAVDLYAQIEFEHRTSLYFDQLVYHVARGHDEARQSVHLAA
jgi:hypothetical protein